MNVDATALDTLVSATRLTSAQWGMLTMHHVLRIPTRRGMDALVRMVRPNTYEITPA